MMTALKIRSKSIVSLFLASLTVLGWGDGSSLAQASEALTVTVSYADLDLNTDAGAKTLYSRLRGASVVVCKPWEGDNLSRVREWHSCYSTAMTSAVAQINRSLLTALHDRATHSSKG